MYFHGCLAGITLCVMGTVFGAENPAVMVNVELFPVGSFTMTAPQVEGRGRKQANAFSAAELKVAVASLDTGIQLRTTHLKQHLKADSFPYITAKNILARNQHGSADLTIRDVTQKVTFTYVDLGNGSAQATFKLNLPSFNLTGIKYLGVGVQDEVEVSATVAYDNN